jgi:hypothetical protein
MVKTVIGGFESGPKRGVCIFSLKCVRKLIIAFPKKWLSGKRYFCEFSQKCHKTDFFLKRLKNKPFHEG